jgi:DNA ligase-1
MGSGTPAKKRKLNDTKSPAPGRSLDYFFGKQKQNDSIQPSFGLEDKVQEGGKGPQLSDEQLARKLQAEWNEEDAQELKENPDNHIADEKLILTNGGVSKSTSPEKHVPKLEEGFPSEVKPPQFSLQPSDNTLSLQSVRSAEDIISSNIPFDESPLTFDPSKYTTELQGHWAAEGGDASYAILTRCFVLVNSTQSRIKIVDTLVNLLRVIIEADPKSLLPTVRKLHYFFHALVYDVQDFDMQDFATAFSCISCKFCYYMLFV